MAEINVMAPPDLEAAAPTPIAQLENSVDDQNSRVVDGVVTITWPYSIVTKSIAFVLAEKDYLLRRNKGQVRVEFHGAAGKALQAAGVGGGDEVRISLNGVQWEPCSTTTRLPGTPLDTQLKFTNRVSLRIRRAETEETSVISVDQPEDEEKEEQTEEPAPLVSSPPLDLSSVFATPRPASPPLRAKRTAATALEPDEYASPAYLKRARVSYGSLFEGGLDIFDDEATKKSKISRRKSRFSMGATGWRYSSKSPSPEPEPTGKEDELEVSESDEDDEIPIPPVSIPKSSMVDEGSQTQGLPVESFGSLTASQSAFLPNTPTPAANPFQTKSNLANLEEAAILQGMAGDRAVGFIEDSQTSTYGATNNLFASQAPLPKLDVEAGASAAANDPMTDSAIDQLLGLEPGSSDASKALPVSEGGFGSSLFGSAPTHGFGWGVPPPATAFPTTTAAAEPQQSAAVIIDSSPVLEVAADEGRSKFTDITEEPAAQEPAVDEDEDAEGEREASEHESIDSTALIIREDASAEEEVEQDAAEYDEDEEQDEDEDERPEERDDEDEQEDDATEYEIRERARQQRLRDGESEGEDVDDQSDDGHYDDEDIEDEDDEEQSRSYHRRREHYQDDDEDEDEDEEQDEEEEQEDEGDYDEEEEEEEEEERPAPPPQPKAPVVIDLLSDSDDDEPVKPTALPASVAPKVEPAVSEPEQTEELEEAEESEREGSPEPEEELEVDEEDAEAENPESPPESPRSQVSLVEQDESEAEVEQDEAEAEEAETEVEQDEAGAEVDQDGDEEMESEGSAQVAEEPVADSPQVESPEPEPAKVEAVELKLVESETEPETVEEPIEEEKEQPLEEEEELVQIVDPESMDVDEEEPAAEEESPVETTEAMDEDVMEDVAEPEPVEPVKSSEAEEPVVEPEELEAAVEHLKPQEQTEVVEVLTSKRVTRSAAALSPPPTQVQLADDGQIHPVEEPNQDELIPVEEVIESQMVTRSAAAISPPPAQVQLADDGAIEAVEESIQIIPEEAAEEEQPEEGSKEEEDEVTAEDQIMEEFLQHSAEQSFLSSSDVQPDDADRKVDPNISARSLRSHRRTRSAQSEQPSIDAVLAEAAESTKTAPKRSRKAPTPVPAPAEPAPRLTRSMIGRADPSVALAKAGISSSPSSQEATPRRRLHRTRTMLDIAGSGREHILDSPYSPRTTRSHDSPASTPAQGTPEPSTSQIHEAEQPVSETVEPAVEEALAPEDKQAEAEAEQDEAETEAKSESGSALRFKLRKSLSTMLPDNFPLDSLRHSLNKVGDIMAVAAAKPEPSHRPRNGPRDYMLELFLTDPSSPSSSVHVAQLYRPHQSALPIVEEGDVVLLRRMQVHAVKGRGFGVRVTDSSSWAVFEQTNDEMLPQIRGPPVEVTDKEIEYAESLQRWWKGLDKRARTNLAKASKKAASAGKG